MGSLALQEITKVGNFTKGLVMAKNSKTKGKVVRQLGVNIYGNHKYDKLLKRKPHPPGKAPRYRRRRKLSEYGLHLIEKQKVRYSYGLREKQFKSIFEKAKKMSGLTGENMLILLEMRLDTVVYRLGFATTMAQARQAVSHGHVSLNGGRSNIPSMIVKVGDKISVPKERAKKMVRANLSSGGINPPSWLSRDEDKLTAEVLRAPEKGDIPKSGDEQMVVEYYSK